MTPPERNGLPRLAEHILGRVVPDPVALEGLLGDLEEELSQGRLRPGVRFWWRFSGLVFNYYAARRFGPRGLVAPTRGGLSGRSEKGVGFIMDELVSDVRMSIRGLGRVPSVAFAAVLCLALGIGAATAIYTAVHWALIRPLPFEDPAELVLVYRTTPNFQSGPFSPGNFVDLRDRTESLESLIATSTGSALLEGGQSEPRRVRQVQASPDIFTMLGVTPAAGRLLVSSDEGAGAASVVVLSFALWQEQYGEDPGAIGSSIDIDGSAHEIVGVAPRQFRVPDGNRGFRGDVWTPLRFTADQAVFRNNNYLRLLGRVADGFTPESAHDEMYSVMAGIIEENPELAGEQLRVRPMQQEAARAVRTPLLLMLGAVGFVLLIAVANVASLLLARGVARRQEFAVRTVLGAERTAVLRPAIVESLLLTGLGSVLGLGLAALGLRAIGSLLPASLSQLQDMSLNAPVLAGAVGLAIGVGLLCAAAPAWQAGSADPQTALRAGGRGSSGTHHAWMQRLVVAEVALSLMLLVGGGLALRGFKQLISQDPGFETDNLLVVDVDVSPGRYEDLSIVESFLVPAVDALHAIPGVQSAGPIQLVPYENWGWNFNVRYEGQPAGDRSLRPLVENRYVLPSTFNTLGQELLAGRLHSPTDDPDGAAVVVANEALVARDFPDQDPIGKRFHLGDSTYATIVGVVSNVRNAGPFRAFAPEVYWAWTQRNYGASSFPIMIRGEDVGSLYPQIQDAIRSVDAAVAISPGRTMNDVIGRSVGSPRFYVSLISVFAFVALALAVAGLYGVMSYVVARRSKELGIRAALGSSPGRTIRTVLNRALLILGVGVLLGLGGALALTRLITGLLYGMSPMDLATWFWVPLLLVTAGVAAALVPALQASRIDPAQVIRDEA